MDQFGGSALVMMGKHVAGVIVARLEKKVLLMHKLLTQRVILLFELSHTLRQTQRNIILWFLNKRPLVV